MSSDWLMIAVPATMECLLTGLCLLVWMRLRRLSVNGVCQWTLVVISADAIVQMGHLAMHVGHAAGVVWLLHAALSYTMVYVLYRLGDLLTRLRTHCACVNSGN